MKAATPSHRLLVHTVAEGWVLLCDFLGVALPNEPFPDLSDRETIKKIIRDIIKGSCIMAAPLSRREVLKFEFLNIGKSLFASPPGLNEVPLDLAGGRPFAPMDVEGSTLSSHDGRPIFCPVRRPLLPRAG